MRRLRDADIVFKTTETRPQLVFGKVVGQLGTRAGMCMKLHAFRLGVDADWNTHTFWNACPQKSKQNGGIWNALEDSTADWADEYGSVWIMAGPVIYNQKVVKWLGQQNEMPVAIPDAFFKIVVREHVGQPVVLAFVFPQEGISYSKKKDADFTPYLTSVDIIEALTGLDFFPDLSVEIQAEIEHVVQVKVWD